MMEVLRAGPLATVQDLGRRGLRALGVGTAGAMDELALRVANILVGNDPGAACVETALLPLGVRFDRRVRVAVTGAVDGTRLGDLDLPPYWTTIADAGVALELPPARDGTWGYLAVEGGIDVPEMMGSRSTDLKGGFGGHLGRSLTAGDRLPVGGPRGGACIAGGRGGIGFGVSPPHGGAKVVLRAIPAKEHASFDDRSRTSFWTAGWTVAKDSNRIGYRLAGPALATTSPLELQSHGIVPGVVQVPPSGQPVVQLSDANTCGGYPKMAVVIGPDLRRLAQVRPGGTVRFREVTRAEASAAIAADRAYLADVAVAARLGRETCP